jgi:hypothetical protein
LLDVTWAHCSPLLDLNKLFFFLYQNIEGRRMEIRRRKKINGKEVGGEKTRKVYDKLEER